MKANSTTSGNKANGLLDDYKNNDDLSQQISNIYEDLVMTFTKSLSSQERSEDEWNDLAGMVIDAASKRVVNMLYEYSGDEYLSPYEPDGGDMGRLKKYYGRMLSRGNNDSLANEIFGSLFRVTYGIQVENAIFKRDMLVSENEKKQTIN